MITTDNPIINSAFEAPEQHLAVGPGYKKATDDQYGICKGRRIAGSIETNGQDQVGTDKESWEKVYSRIERIRECVKSWRESEYANSSNETHALLYHWNNQTGKRRPFFCQLEAVETRIWLEEIAPSDDEGEEIIQELNQANSLLNKELNRVATKMATGTGKTRAMAMLMVWLASRRKDRVSDFLIITPNKTVTSRLQELLPGNRNNIYGDSDLYAPNLPKPSIRITIAHWQQFVCKKKYYSTNKR